MSKAPDRAVVRAELVRAAFVAVLALLGTAVIMRLWNASLSTPLAARGDGDFELLEVAAMLEHGWYQTLSGVGAPFGTTLHDFPQDAGSLGQSVVLLILAKLTGNAVVAMNLFLLGAFATIAVSAYAVGRAMGVRPLLAGAAALLYTWLPFHFFRAWDHLNFADYTTVPLAGWVLLRTLQDGALLVRSETGAWRSRRNVAVLLALLAAGLGNVYFALFTVMMVGVTVVFTAIARGDRGALRPAAAGLLVAAVLPMVPVGVGYLPSALHRREHGVNPVFATRAVSDSERYALKPTILVLPLSYHRLSPLSELKSEYLNAEVPTFNESDHATLGVVGSVGLLTGIVALLLPGLRRRPYGDAPDAAGSAHDAGIGAGAGADAGPAGEAGASSPEATDQQLALLTRHAGFGALVGIALGTLGGGGMLFALLVSPQIRSWNRIVVFIGFFAFLALAAAVHRLAVRRGWGGPVLAGAVVLVTLAATADQTRGTLPFVPPHRPLAEQKASDRAFAGALRTQLGTDTPSLYTAPYIGFPEGVVPSGEVDGYPFARLVAMNPGISLTWGAISGRPADWTSDWMRMPAPLELAGATAAGMDGVMTLPGAFLDPAEGADLLANAQKMGGGPSFASPDGRYAAAALPTPADVEAVLPPGLSLEDLRTWALSPLRFQTLQGGATVATTADGLSMRTRLPSGSAVLGWQLNDGDPRPAVLAGRVVRPDGASTVTVIPAGGQPQTAQVSEQGDFRFTFEVPTGPSSVELRLPPGAAIDNLRLMARPGA